MFKRTFQGGLLFLLLVGTVEATPIGAQPGQVETVWNALDLTAALGVSQDFSLAIGTNGAPVTTWQTIFSVAPASITITLEGSTDCVNYNTVDTSTNVNGEIRTVFGTYKCVRFNNSAVGTGAGKTLTAKLLYTTGRSIGSSSGTTVYNGGTFTGPLLLPDGTAAAPGLAFSSTTGTGFWQSSNTIRVSNSGVERYEFGSGGLFTIGSTSAAIGLGVTAPGPDVFLYREAANALALRNSTNAQTFNIYNTYTDGSNYSRVALTSTGTGFDLIQQDLGTGTSDAKRGFRSIQGSKSLSLTDAAAAATVWSCAVPTSDYLGGELIWTTKSTDATDFRSTQGAIRFAGVNKAGTTTCTVGVIGTDLTASSNANTLVCTWTNVSSTTNCLLKVTCTDNTAGTQTMSVNSRLDMPLPQVCTPQ